MIAVVEEVEAHYENVNKMEDEEVVDNERNYSTKKEKKTQQQKQHQRQLEVNKKIRQ